MAKNNNSDLPRTYQWKIMLLTFTDTIIINFSAGSIFIYQLHQKSHFRMSIGFHSLVTYNIAVEEYLIINTVTENNRLSNCTAQLLIIISS